MNPKKFVEIWQTSKSVDEVKKKTGVSKPTLYKRAQYYRKKGVPLQKFLDRKPNEWNELIDLAKKLRVDTVNCPACNHKDTRIIERRNYVKVARRRRQCHLCKHRFTTYEIMKKEYKKPKKRIKVPKKMIEVKKEMPKPKTKEEKRRQDFFNKFGKTKVQI